MEIRTVRGYLFGEVTSAMQKAIRRGDAKLAGYMAIELLHSGYHKYVWKRLFTVAAEDTYGMTAKEVHALHEGFRMVNPSGKETGSPGGPPKGRIFVAKAVIILCLARKSRDSDHLTNLVYDGKRATDEEVAEYLQALDSSELERIPEYAYDCHTGRGRRAGKTKDDFFTEEFDALNPREPGLFDDLL